LSFKQHAFVAMPFGTKPGADGQPIDFNRIYLELIKPALEDAGFEVFRADEETRAGDIRTDMFQELLAADLVVADLTLDNPNVWYELGVRHALRARGVVLVQGPRSTSPFDIYTDRKLRYGVAAGAPDPATLGTDRAALAKMARETQNASTRRKVSPVYTLLPHLQQPRWQDLLLSGDNEFAQRYEAWRSRLEVAQQKHRAGDILVLAEETPVRALAVEARFQAGRALMRLPQFTFALEQFDAALAVDDEHLGSLQQRAVCLGRLRRTEEAREAALQLTEAHPQDPECWSLAGRVEKSAWIDRFREPGEPWQPGAFREKAALEDALLAEAITPYRRAFATAPGHLFAGVNALTLNTLRAHLGGEHDPAETDRLLAGLRWGIACALERQPKDYWARAAQAEVSLLCFERAAVQRDWRAAAAAAGRDWLALDSSRQQLQLLSGLGFRPDETALALGIVEAELRRLNPPFVPRQVLLFSGHIMDAPSRPEPRFPLAMEPAARAALEQALDRLGAGPEDIALTQGAAGGDLMFTEAAQARGVKVHWMQPLPEPQFIESSVQRATNAEDWRVRYYAARAQLAEPPRSMAQELGPPPPGVNVWERGNRWLLHTTLAYGPDKARCVVLWDGGGGDGPGGTRHMVEEIKRRTGRVQWIDTRRLPLA
jgi:tetratricopeptide (TPR) repeat protein